MEEKILIKSERYNVKILLIILLIAGVILSVSLLISQMSPHIKRFNKEIYPTYKEHQADGTCGMMAKEWFQGDGNQCWNCITAQKHHNAILYGFSRTFEKLDYKFLIPIPASFLIAIFIYLWFHSYELTITDKRIYGKVAFGKRVDLPIDSISATATIRLFKGVSVSTASGRIGFLVIKNSDKIYDVVSQLLINRQQEKNNLPQQSPQINDETDQLKKYKDLLDSGVITQEEFDAKKKQLLGL